MNRTKLRDRELPEYTRGEERFNMISHIVGGGIGVLALIACVLISVFRGDVYAVVSSAIYGSSLIALYATSSVYHGLRAGMAKKVMQVLDHCIIYYLIAGTYTPITLCAIRPVHPVWGWGIFSFVWCMAALAAVFTAIDLKKYAALSMIAYIGMGWCVLASIKVVIDVLPPMGLFYLFVGGVAYTVGAILYGVGKKHRYMHSVFHLFVLLGSIFHLICIAVYVL